MFDLKGSRYGCEVCVKNVFKLFFPNAYEMLVLETLTCDFWRKSRTKRSFWRLDA